MTALNIKNSNSESDVTHSQPTPHTNSPSPRLFWEKGPGAEGHSRRRAFTLIELLVVIALTAILLTLVFAPLISTLNLTSRAGTQIEAQTTARDVLRTLEAELSGPVFIYDNVFQGLGDPNGYGRLGDPDGRVNIWLHRRGATNNPLSGIPVVKPIRFGMIEYVQPAGQAESSLSTVVDPTTGKSDPGSSAPSNVALPLVRGRTIVRIFPGAQDNRSGATNETQDGQLLFGQPVDAQLAFHGYANRYDDAADVTPRQDNRVTLYRAEIQPYVLDPNALAGTIRYVPNIALFHTILNGVKTGNPQGQSDPTGTIILDDPNFFYDTTPVPRAYVLAGAPGVDIGNRATVPMWECWKAVSQPLLPLTKGDAIALERDDRHQIVYRDKNGLQPQDPGSAAPFDPVMRPLITFTPQYVENDPGVPASLEASASETPYTAATTFRTQHGAWARPFRVIVYRSPDGLQDPLTLQNPISYEMDDQNSGIFDANDINRVNKGPALNPDGSWGTGNTPEFAFTADYDKGTVNFAFPHTVYDRKSDGSPLPMYYNASTINGEIDMLLNGELKYGKRFLWLRDFDTTNTLNPVGAQSPLFKFYVPLDDPIKTPPTQPKVRIVPGSERVFGPDQLPGAHYGYRTQYTRVSATAGQIGPNQYKILYENAANAGYVTDITDPRVQTGYIEFDSLPDKDIAAIPNPGSVNLAPSLENPSLAAGNVPLYRQHSLPLLKYDPATSANVAADPVEVSYNFQMNRPSDVVKIDYLTRSIINITMEMRLYDPRSARPQTTQLTSKVSARNLQR